MFPKPCRVGLAALLVGVFFLTSAALAAAPEQANQEKQVRALVKSAVKLVKAKGEAAFAEFNVKNGPWHKGDTCIFVSDRKGVERANAASPELVGKNLWNHKDPDGRLVVQEQWKLVDTKGRGWIESKWAKPGTDKPLRCRSYVQGVKVKGQRYMVGAAYWLE